MITLLFYIFWSVAMSAILKLTYGVLKSAIEDIQFFIRGYRSGICLADGLLCSGFWFSFFGILWWVLILMMKGEL